MSKTVVLTSCGTSLLTNAARPEQRSLLSKTANKSLKELSDDETSEIQALLDRVQSNLLNAESLDPIRAASAELNGLISFYGGQLKLGNQDNHYLLHTDTYQGVSIAELLVQWLETKGLVAQPVKIPDMNTKSIQDFTSGASWLIKWCEDNLSDYRDSQYRVVFNLTGGFKSLQGFLQTVGMFYADEIVYIFESSSELLRIPRLPITPNADKIIRDNLKTFRMLGMGRELPVKECRSIPETLLTVIDDRAAFSPWGELVWKRSCEQFSSGALLDPLFHCLEYSSRFKKDVEQLEGQRKTKVNSQLDVFADLMDANKMANQPRSLGFKELYTKKLAPSTHELYAWSDAGAYRIYGHFEERSGGKIFVVDQLGGHLKKNST
jgi:putative CRISPR-associated protein (TIGR02619 family)